MVDKHTNLCSVVRYLGGIHVLRKDLDLRFLDST
jgi:hypothetical protein